MAKATGWSNNMGSSSFSGITFSKNNAGANGTMFYGNGYANVGIEGAVFNTASLAGQVSTYSIRVDFTNNPWAINSQTNASLTASGVLKDTKGNVIPLGSTYTFNYSAYYDGIFQLAISQISGMFTVTFMVDGVLTATNYLLVGTSSIYNYECGGAYESLTVGSIAPGQPQFWENYNRTVEDGTGDVVVPGVVVTSDLGIGSLDFNGQPNTTPIITDLTTRSASFTDADSFGFMVGMVSNVQHMADNITYTWTPHPSNTGPAIAGQISDVSSTGSRWAHRDYYLYGATGFRGRLVFRGITGGRLQASSKEFFIRFNCTPSGATASSIQWGMAASGTIYSDY